MSNIKFLNISEQQIFNIQLMFECLAAQHPSAHTAQTSLFHYNFGGNFTDPPNKNVKKLKQAIWNFKYSPGSKLGSGTNAAEDAIVSWGKDNEGTKECKKFKCPRTKKLISYRYHETNGQLNAPFKMLNFPAGA